MLDLRIARLVQIMHAIRETREAEARTERALVEWQTKTLAAFIASTIQDNEAREKSVEAAAKLSIEGDGEADTSHEDTRSWDEILKYGDTKRALAKNMKRKGPGIFGMS